MIYELINCICCANCDKCPANNGEGLLTRQGSLWVDSEKGVSKGAVCGHYTPGFITPTQFRERTGRKYPADAPVWAEITIDGEHKGWALATNRANAAVKICAFGDFVPSKDWKPEMTEKDKCMGGER